MDRADAVIVGAGVVGLAIAETLARRGIPALILDGEPHFGSWTSSRNSEVIHAGIYYSPGSLKARLCVEGRDRIYAFCESSGVPHKRLGKIIFAHSPDQSGELDAIEHAADTAGAGKLERLTSGQAKRLEPELDVADALLSPMTGIIDAHGYMQALIGSAEARGANLVCSTKVIRATRSGNLWRIWIEGMDAPVLETPILVNSAGLAAQTLARSIEGLPADRVPPLRLARGVYFTHSGRLPFNHLIYPVPEPGGLGTHLTLDLAGQARFGPDVEWIDDIDYTVDPARKERFVNAARRIWPKIDPDRLQPGYAGIRPKLSGPDQPSADFLIEGPGEHGLPGLVNLFGIESPGLTASMAIGDLVAQKLS
ncbi:NAD(P)/FAD-dependent oxidoreductase [Novosphingobium mathurense]|uniref:L-2-hydroxyglutarate oxidase LhgO n=1 Tax=Novosphingobium mathurense TaxID=428990 RepID=A0A1U6HZJ1_9SPHN|nr:NAD(P)/FAD-dependent oxidoreductase [Novosphingobium mathurense]SLK01198.1 L-2-hydroxyglutarate oxidase LhgO [Novosphingobium mathurense]